MQVQKTREIQNPTRHIKPINKANTETQVFGKTDEYYNAHLKSTKQYLLKSHIERYNRLRNIRDIITLLGEVEEGTLKSEADQTLAAEEVVVDPARSNAE